MITEISDIEPDLPHSVRQIGGDFTIWWLAVHSLNPGYTPANIAFHLGLPWMLSLPDCRTSSSSVHLDTFRAMWVADLGVKARTLDTSNVPSRWVPQIVRSLEAGLPVLIRLPQERSASGKSDRSLHLCRSVDDLAAIPHFVEILRAGNVIMLRRSGLPVRRGSIIETMFLLEWAAIGWETRLITSKSCTDYTVAGADAFYLWYKSGRANRRRAERWAAITRLQAEYLHEIAGGGRKPAALRLKWASESLEQLEHEVLIPCVARVNRKKLVSLLTLGEDLEERTRYLIADAALRRLALPETVMRTLLESPEEPLADIPLQEMIYLARAGATPLRHMALRRMRDSHDPQAMTTITQWIKEKNPLQISTNRG